jgi:hypothetical protein
MTTTFLKKITPARIALILISLLAFILALTLLKEGARALAPWLEETFDLSGIVHILGFGWFSAARQLPQRR